MIKAKENFHKGYLEEIMPVMKTLLHPITVPPTKHFLLLIAPNPMIIGKGVGGAGAGPIFVR
jgi:hypothetical protein